MEFEELKPGVDVFFVDVTLHVIHTKIKTVSSAKFTFDSMCNSREMHRAEAKKYFRTEKEARDGALNKLKKESERIHKQIGMLTASHVLKYFKKEAKCQ